MMQKYLKILILIFPFVIFSQQEFHVFPEDHKKSPGTTSGIGTLKSPWDLQTALNQLSNVVDGGDVIWIHEGIYNGRFLSLLGSSKNDKKVTVSAFENDKVVLNGNLNSKKGSVLEVRGNRVIFKNLEITFLGDFSRKQGENGFQIVNGISHVSGINCEFINLKVHNNPGSGIGSWKRTGGSLIYGCTIFNNGYFSTKRGSGVGMYVQNESDQTRMIKNNIIFNNYYKGIEVWSASKKAKTSYIQNITLQNNVVFNNGLPAGKFRDNLIIATDDKNAINVAKNILVKDNIFYHNTNYMANEVNGNASSLTLGYNARAPLENVVVTDNIILGRNNALRFNNAKSLVFKSNIVYCGYVHLNKSVLNNIDTWNFDKNTYFTKRNVPFRISNHKDYKLNDWKSQFPIDKNSTWKHLKEFDLNEVLDLTQNENDQKMYKAVLFNKKGEDVTIDFSNFEVTEGQSYSVVDVATDEIVSSGKIMESKKIKVTIGKYNQTHDNFGVFKITFAKENEKKTNFLKRFFKWLF